MASRGKRMLDLVLPPAKRRLQFNYSSQCSVTSSPAKSIMDYEERSLLEDAYDEVDNSCRSDDFFWQSQRNSSFGNVLRPINDGCMKPRKNNPNSFKNFTHNNCLQMKESEIDLVDKENRTYVNLENAVNNSYYWDESINDGCTEPRNNNYNAFPNMNHNQSLHMNESELDLVNKENRTYFNLGNAFNNRYDWDESIIEDKNAVARNNEIKRRTEHTKHMERNEDEIVMDNDKEEDQMDDDEKLLKDKEEEEKKVKEVHETEKSTQNKEQEKVDKNENSTNKDHEKQLMDEVNESENENDKTPTKENGRRKSRRRSRNPSKWKKNVRKESVQKGKEHLSDKGKIIPGKIMKESCHDTPQNGKRACTFNCSKLITNEQRSDIFKHFYSLQGKEKHCFLLSNTLQFETKLSRKNISKNKREVGYSYFLPLDGIQVHVCKEMFLNTLGISQKMVYGAYKNKKADLVPGDDLRGKHTKSKVSEEKKNLIRQHISSFHAVESHYCRASTSKKYLDPSLNISKMYRLYKELLTENKMEDMICTEALYRQIFCTEYNIDFLQPKSDLCEECEQFRLAEKEKRVTDALRSSYELHIEKKNKMRAERLTDRLCNDENIVTVLFDLENVVPLPKTNIGVAFYKRKVNAYNLTGHAVQFTKTGKKKKVYTAVWTELMCGRGGNDIASAVFKILTRVMKDFENVKKIITWSDSCVPQNRNQMMSFAMGQLLNDFQELKQITMKYSMPGHGVIQEVDNVHSQVEKALRTAEIWSIRGFLSLLNNVNTRNPFTVIQMQPSDFIDFHFLSKHLKYNEVPFFSTAQLHFFKKRRYQIYYQCGHQENEFTKVDLRKRKRKNSFTFRFPKSADDCPRSSKKLVVSDLKVKDIASLFDDMPKADRQYYKKIFNLP